MTNRFVITFLVSGLFCGHLSAADWPMWRHNSGRTAVTADELPKSLKLDWVRELPVVEPAFRNARLQFDTGYEPIVAGGRLLIASSKTDSVTAFDIETGEQKWIYRANGPVRFAPAVWQDAVCFGSDDGCLYCVDLKSGDLRWKHRAVPSDRKLLGNKRLISVWPVRGGPVVADGRVYFAAGVWPFEGVFVYAMDIASGKVIWRNDRLGYMFGQQPHNTEAIGGLAPQGYLVIDGDKLVVPCSTAYPATLNRESGELVEFALPAPGRFPGGWFAAIDEATAKDVRRGKITFDEVINSELHEDTVRKGDGVAGISRRIKAGDRSMEFDDSFEGVEGTVHAMIVADRRLFVSTREGRIYCFADAERVKGQDAKMWGFASTPVAASAQSKKFVAGLLTNVDRHGYAFVAGLADGSLVKALLTESDLHVVAIDDNADLVAKLRSEFSDAGIYGTRVAVLHADPGSVELPPYVGTLVTTESPNRLTDSRLRLLQTVRPFGGVAAFRRHDDFPELNEQTTLVLEAGNFERMQSGDEELIRRVGPLPGTTNYTGDFKASPDLLVRFPLGVLWFDDALAHFKRSPQPQFVDGVMISRPKDWHAPRVKGVYTTDYPLLPPVLSDMYTGRVLNASEQNELRSGLVKTDPVKPEPSQYRPPGQKDMWKPEDPVVGERTNPLTGEKEPRAFPKTYGCDGGVDYGSFYTLRAGTPAFYDKTAESGTVFLSGPRSGCTNSIIPAGGLLNVPYFYEGCTCSYPLPSALSLVAMPESHEQWSSWGETEVEPKSIQRIGLNFGAPGDRITRSRTLWLDYPSVGGPSPKVRVETVPAKLTTRYRHSIWMTGDSDLPWVSASTVEGLESLTLHGLKPGRYTVRLYFAELDDIQPGDRVQQISIQGKVVLPEFDIVANTGESMKGIVHVVKDVKVDDTFTLDLSATKGDSLISGVELIADTETAKPSATSDASAQDTP